MSNLNSNEISFGLNPSIWLPKEKENCDFKPDDLGPNSTWVSAKITKVSNNPNDPEQKILKISYKVNNVEKNASLLYPSIVLKKCGEAILSRKDC